MPFVVLWLVSILAVFLFSIPSLREAIRDQDDAREAGLGGRYLATAEANVRREVLRLVVAVLFLLTWAVSLIPIAIEGSAGVAGFAAASFLVASSIVMAAQSFLDRQWRKNVTRVELDRAIREHANEGPQRREGEQ